MSKETVKTDFRYKAVAVVLLWWLALNFASYFGLGEIIENGVKRPLEIKFREWSFSRENANALKADIKLDPRVKMVVFDERTVARIKRPDLSTEEWTKVFKLLAEQKPKVILLDFTFSLPFGDAQMEQLLNTISKSSVPIVSAVQIRDYQVEGKVDLLAYAKENNLEYLFKSKDIQVDASFEPAKTQHVYGAVTDIAKSVAGLGHIHYDGIGNIKPVFLLKDGYAVKNLAFHAATKFDLRDTEVGVDGVYFGLNKKLEMPVNFRSVRYYENQENTISLNGILKTIEKNSEVPEGIFSEGDVIIIAKTFFGSTDFAQTPAGYMPGVYVLATVVDSILTGRWLTKMGNVYAVTLFFSIFGGALAFLLPAVSFALILSATAASILIVGFFAFSLSGMLLPWDMAFIAFVGGSFVVFGEKIRMIENRSKQLRYRLTRFIPSTRLSEMIKKPETMVWDPCGKVVSIMFVDMVSFSTTVEKQSVNDVFFDLREMINSIIETIHLHGGIVQKTLGDGVLAHFGYDYDGEKTRREHTDRIVACAIDIQRKNLELNSIRVATGKFVYPLRVGIHTSNVFLGNIGDDLLPDITMVGHGVNFAKRMENTCEPFRIMLSATTYECINADLFKDCEFSTRQIHVKHFDKPVTATEINPIVGKDIQQKRIEQHFRECLGIERNEMRWPLGDSVPISVTSPQTAGKIIDYSRSGFLIQLDKYYGKGVKLTLTLHSIDESINKELEKNGFSQIVVEVRWGSIIKDEYVHGVMISSLTDRQKNTFENILKDRLGKADYFSDAS